MDALNTQLPVSACRNLPRNTSFELEIWFGPPCIDLERYTRSCAASRFRSSLTAIKPPTRRSLRKSRQFVKHSRRFRFQKRGQHFIGTHNETLSVAMRINDPNRSRSHAPIVSTSEKCVCRLWLPDNCVQSRTAAWDRTT